MSTFERPLIVGKKDNYTLTLSSRYLAGEVITSSTVTTASALLTIDTNSNDGVTMSALCTGVGVGDAELEFTWSTATRSGSEKLTLVVSDKDIIKPVIILNPLKTLYSLNVNDSFTLPIATVIDNIDADRIINPSFNDVNTTAAGSYNVIYTAVDSDGSNAEPVIVNVDVITAEARQSLLSMNRSEFILQGDQKYTSMKGRSNQSAFKFKLQNEISGITLTQEGFFDFSNNNISKVEVLAADSVISSSTEAVSFEGDTIYAELGLLEGFGFPALRVVIYVLGDSKGVEIVGPKLTSSPVITML